MSRLIFLNLPPTLTTPTFQSQLTSPPKLQGSTTITDLKLVTRRRFAFVGYKTEDEARRVKEYFDGSFGFGAGKVRVDFVKDEPLTPKTSKIAKPKSSVVSPTLETDSQPVAGPSREPSKRLKEFMDVMTGAEAVPVASTSAPVAVPGDEGWLADGEQKKKGDKRNTAKENEPDESKDARSPEAEETVEDGDDAAWLRRRQAATNGASGEEADDRPSADEQLILSTGRLFIRNLAFITTSSDLSTHFSTFGPIDEVHLPLSQSSSQPLGTAFIQFRHPPHALAAYKALDKSTFQGRLLHVLPGRAKPVQERSGVDGIIDGQVLGKVKEGRGEVKKGVETRRREESSKGVNWASMYMNSDAVAASVADRMGITKSDLLSADSSNAAVSLALAETHVIAETKKYFEDAGIVLESLSPKVPRSQTTILVKNIPYGTTVHTLTDLFEPHGKLVRVLLPPAGTLGVVEFENSMDAGRAFKALAYKRMGNAVLYLEKGPVGMFKAAPTHPSERENEAKLLAEKVANATRDAPDASDEAGSTLFLKNLSFTTTTKRLTIILSTLPSFSFARVQTKPDPKRPGERLSMGYGFVGFTSREAASKAIGGIHGCEVDGKALEAKFAQRGAEGTEEKGGGELKGKTKSTKVLVKNLPFEASKKDVRELFSAYGTLKSLRLPKRSTLASTGAQSTRGFAFLEFTTHTEALRAMEALKHTHLLGRHLVLEWAKEGEGVDVGNLRERVGRDWRGNRAEGEGERVGKRRKLDLGGGAGQEMDGLVG